MLCDARYRVWEAFTFFNVRLLMKVFIRDDPLGSTDKSHLATSGMLCFVYSLPSITGYFVFIFLGNFFFYNARYIYICFCSMTYLQYMYLGPYMLVYISCPPYWYIVCCLLYIEVSHGWWWCCGIIVQIYSPATERKYSKCKGRCRVVQVVGISSFFTFFSLITTCACS